MQIVYGCLNVYLPHTTSPPPLINVGKIRTDGLQIGGSNIVGGGAEFALHICDMIKGNESLVENFYSYFLAPFSHNFDMLHFDPNPITIGYLVTEL